MDTNFPDGMFKKIDGPDKINARKRASMLNSLALVGVGFVAALLVILTLAAFS